jgi:toxin YoeB
MNDVSFTRVALKDYMEWQTEDRKTLKKINGIIEDILRNGLLCEMPGKIDFLQKIIFELNYDQWKIK